MQLCQDILPNTDSFKAAADTLKVVADTIAVDTLGVVKKAITEAKESVDWSFNPLDALWGIAGADIALVVKGIGFYPVSVDS